MVKGNGAVDGDGGRGGVLLRDGRMERWRAACAERPAPQEPESIEFWEISDGRAVQGKEEERRGKRLMEDLHRLLPKLHTKLTKAVVQAAEQERALLEIRAKFFEANALPQRQKEWARSQWQKVADEESNIDQMYAIKKMEQHEFYEEQRRR